MERTTSHAQAWTLSNPWMGAAADAELTGIAADRRHHRPQSGGLVLNAAYLVDDDAVADFRTRVACLARDARPVLIEATGPWPAYSFATPDPTEVSA